MKTKSKPASSLDVHPLCEQRLQNALQNLGVSIVRKEIISSFFFGLCTRVHLSRPLPDAILVTMSIDVLPGNQKHLIHFPTLSPN